MVFGFKKIIFSFFVKPPHSRIDYGIIRWYVAHTHGG